MTNPTSIDNFLALDIRVGTIIGVEESRTNKPTWKLTIDFGSDLGKKISCGAYKNYSPAELEGLQVICIVNLGVRKMGPETSEVLVLGVAADGGGTNPLTVKDASQNGLVIF